MNEIQSYWETCGYRFSHLTNTPDRIIEKGSELLSKYEQAFLLPLSYTTTFKNKTLLDFGIGNAELGRFFLSEGIIDSYIGVDIAERSIEFAMKNLTPYLDKCQFMLSPSNLSKINADIFMSLACIQHFPSVAYLDEFLIQINTGNFSIVILQIRSSNSGETLSDEKAYKEGGNVALALQTSESYVSKRLDNFTIFHASDIHKSGYQYLVYLKGESDAIA